MLFRIEYSLYGRKATKPPIKTHIPARCSDRAIRPVIGLLFFMLHDSQFQVFLYKCSFLISWGKAMPLNSPLKLFVF